MLMLWWAQLNALVFPLAMEDLMPPILLQNRPTKEISQEESLDKQGIWMENLHLEWRFKPESST